MLKCPNCQALNLEGAQLCKLCRMPLDKALQQHIPKSQTAAQPNTQSLGRIQAPTRQPSVSSQNKGGVREIGAAVQSSPAFTRLAQLPSSINREAPAKSAPEKNPAAPQNQPSQSRPPANQPSIRPRDPPSATAPKLGQPVNRLAQERPQHLQRVVRTEHVTMQNQPVKTPAQPAARPEPAMKPASAAPPPVNRQPAKPVPPPPKDASQRAFDMKMKMIIRCPGCGKKLEDGNYCKHCGVKLG